MIGKDLKDYLDRFFSRNKELFEDDRLMKILTKEQHFVINTYYLAIKNNLHCSDNEEENVLFILFVIAKLTETYGIFNSECKPGYICRFLYSIASTINLRKEEINGLSTPRNNINSYISLDVINSKLLDIQNQLDELKEIKRAK